MKKRKIVTIAVMLCVLVILGCLALGYTLERMTAKGETTDAVSEDGRAEDVGISSEEIDEVFKRFEAWVDKYIMPLAISVLTAISLVVTVFLKFKQMFNLYKTNKDEFVLTAEKRAAELKEITDEAIEAIKGVKEQVAETVKNMPIEKISQDLRINTDDTVANTQALKKFKELFAVMFKINRESDRNLICSEEERKYLAKLYDEADKVVAEVTQSDEWKQVAQREQGAEK